MNINSTKKTNEGVLASLGLRVELKNVEIVLEKIQKDLIKKLTKDLKDNFTITDLIDKEKSGKILSNYRKYFTLGDAESYPYLEVNSCDFLSEMDEINEYYIKSNIDYYKELLSMYVEDGLTDKDLKLIPKVFAYYFAKHNCSYGWRDSIFELLSYIPPYKAMLRSDYSLSDNATNKKLKYLLPEMLKLGLFTQEVRLEAYKQIIHKGKEFIEKSDHRYYKDNAEAGLKVFSEKVREFEDKHIKENTDIIIYELEGEI